MSVEIYSVAYCESFINVLTSRCTHTKGTMIFWLRAMWSICGRFTCKSLRETDHCAWAYSVCYQRLDKIILLFQTDSLPEDFLSLNKYHALHISYFPRYFSQLLSVFWTKSKWNLHNYTDMCSIFSTKIFNYDLEKIFINFLCNFIVYLLGFHKPRS